MMWATMASILLGALIHALQGKLGADLVELVQKGIAVASTAVLEPGNTDRRALAWKAMTDEAQEVGGDLFEEFQGVSKRVINLLIELLLVRAGLDDGSIK